MHFKIFSALLLLAGISASAQKTKSDVFSTQEIVWYGLDFSKIKLIGPEGFTDPNEIKNRFFPSWNQLFLFEADKYDLKKTFKKTTVINELSIVEERNKLPDASELVITTSYSIDEAVVEEVVKQYKGGAQTEGVGLVFVMEKFDKTAEVGTMYVTFFDIATKKVLLSKKMGGKPGGFGLRNFWAATYYEVLKQCAKEFPKWK
jgi:hypothetical protein